jgi:raffinose/stachyose/melibiose transport system permease protein
MKGGDAVRLRTRTALLLMMPALALYSVFLLYPAVRGIAISFTDAQGVAGGHYVGLANYRLLLHDHAVTAALHNTVVYTVVVAVVQNGLGLALAYWLNSVPAVRNVVRAGLLLPSMMAIILIGYVWSYIYSPLDGPLNVLLRTLGLHRFEQVWLGNPKTALLAIAATNIWAYVGYSTTIFLSGYMAIPASIFEAAELDGARGWRRFWRIDWRLLAPALTVNLTLSTINLLRAFDLPLVMTHGGPNDATQMFSFVIYEDSFQAFNFGYGTAVAVLLLVITIAVSVVMTTLLRRREVSW